MNLNDRKVLQEIYNAATVLSNVDGANFNWIRIYWRLADAANQLDAFLARVELEKIKEQDQAKEKESK